MTCAGSSSSGCVPELADTHTQRHTKQPICWRGVHVRAREWKGVAGMEEGKEPGESLTLRAEGARPSAATGEELARLATPPTPGPRPRTGLAPHLAAVPAPRQVPTSTAELRDFAPGTGALRCRRRQGVEGGKCVGSPWLVPEPALGSAPPRGQGAGRRHRQRWPGHLPCCHREGGKLLAWETPSAVPWEGSRGGFGGSGARRRQFWGPGLKGCGAGAGRGDTFSAPAPQRLLLPRIGVSRRWEGRNQTVVTSKELLRAGAVAKFLPFNIVVQHCPERGFAEHGHH